MTPLPPRSTLFPYTTLFRSRKRRRCPSKRRSRPLVRGWIFSPDLSLIGVQRNWTSGRGQVKISSLALAVGFVRSEEHTSELQSHSDLVCRLLLEKKKKHKHTPYCSPFIPHDPPTPPIYTLSLHDALPIS